MSSTKSPVILLLALSLLIAARANAGVLISADASPRSIPADGRSYSQILVTVLDQTGAPVQDDTEVRLTTSAGDITPAVYTNGGRAVGVLTSSTCPQIAIVTAIADGAAGSVQVEFLSSGYEEVAASSKAIRMTGGSLAYSVDQDTVLGSNLVTIEYKGLTIRAASAQVCQTIGEIRAQGQVSVQKADQTLTADAFVCDIHNSSFRLLDSNDQPSTRMFDMNKFQLIGSDSAAANDEAFSPLMNVDGKTWIVSKRLVLIPGQQILFYKASIYVGDSKVLSVPYYSYSYEKRESILQQVRYTSSDGMLVDLPFYYRVADSGTGALKLRYAASGGEFGGYSRPRKGVSMGLEQSYSIGNRSQGRLFVDSLGSSSQAFEMAHHIELGSAVTGGRADLSARYQPSSRYASNIYNATLSMMGDLGDYNYSVSGYLGGSRIQMYDYLNPDTLDYVDQSSGSIRAIFRPRAPILSKGLGRLSPSLTVGYGSLWTSDDTASSGLYQSLGLSFNRSTPSNGRTALSFDGLMGLTMTSRGNTGASLRFRPSLRTYWLGGSASVSYTLNLQGGTTDSVSPLAKHELGCSLFLSGGGKWSTHLFADYGLDSRRLNLSSGLSYQATKYWRIRTTYNLYRYTYEMNGSPYSYANSYLKVGIYRPIGPYEIGLAWSPNGDYYGIDKGKRVWLELGGRGF